MMFYVDKKILNKMVLCPIKICNSKEVINVNNELDKVYSNINNSIF